MLSRDNMTELTHRHRSYQPFLQTGYRWPSADCSEHGATPSTRNVYITGQRRFKEFCSSISRRSLPTTEATFDLATSGLSFATIKV